VVTKPNEPTPSGEEGDIIVFEAKSRVLVFENGWKSFAQGNLKINKNKENNKCRIILRKEGGLTLVLNAPLFPKMTITKQGDRAVIFPVATETKGEDSITKVVITQYVAKFQTGKEAETFYNSLQECKNLA